MDKIFEAALSISYPWYMKDMVFAPCKKRLDLYPDFKKGSTFKVDEPVMTYRIKFIYRGKDLALFKFLLVWELFSLPYTANKI